MSVLVPSFPSSSNSSPHYFRNLSQSTKSIRSISPIQQDVDYDHVPFGVVNSMKQRFLDKVNESLLLNKHHSFTKSSNENLFSTKSFLSPLKQTTRLSRSQDNLLHHPVEPLTSYLQPKQNLIIVDTTSNDLTIPTHRHSYIELHGDEVPKPGTVTTVKNMFERQIRLSRYDCEKLSHGSSLSTHMRVHSLHREIASPNRSRSISPNDMAIRQRRSVAISTGILPSSARLSLPVSASYPDLVISHTPPTSTQFENNLIMKKDSEINVPKDENLTVHANSIRPNMLQPSITSSDTADYQPLDFKSRLALFNRTNTIERTNEHPPTSVIFRKPPNHSLPSNFLTKPIVHHHSSEKKDLLSDQVLRSIVQTAKPITFFGGVTVNESTSTKSTLPPSIDLPPPPPLIDFEETSIDFVHVPDVIGGNVKLTKSSIFSGMRKVARVQFIDNVNTFEYPSYHLTMSEFGSSDSDEHEEKNPIDEVDDDELEQLAHLNAEKALEPKGSLHTFRPSYLDHYELGTQHGSTSSDINLRESYHSKFKQELTNNIQWSSMSTTTDLLF